MTDTDRLAALLHAEWDRRIGEWSEPDVPCDVCEESAARLIAAGVRVGDDGLRDALERLDHPEPPIEPIGAIRRRHFRLGWFSAMRVAQDIVREAALAAQPAPPALDRERLARALRQVAVPGSQYNDLWAAAIAAAYEADR